MNEKLVSIIVPVYNAENFLADTLNDLIVQTYKNIEIIIINDGSGDRSREIIWKYQKKDNRIKLIDVDNGGPSKARNLGLRIAKGEYIRFIDADDRVPKDSIKNMVEVYELYVDIDLVIGNYVCMPDKGYFLGNDLISSIILKDEFVDLFINNIKSFYFGVPWNKLYKREIIEQNNIKFDEDIIWCEDFVFNIEYYKKCEKIYVLNVPEGVYFYQIQENGITNTINEYKYGKMKEIDLLRYNKAREYCREYQREKEFELEWNYIDMYDQLSFMTKKITNRNIKQRYLAFKSLLSDPEAYQYICMKREKQNSYIWEMLRKVIKKKSYKSAFIIFVIKGVIMQKTGFIAKIVKQIVQPIIPKSL